MHPVSFNSVSISYNPYQVEMDVLPQWQLYWLKEISCMDLYQALSDAVINQPYADMPDYLLKQGTTTIYHPNHDTSHSIRQVVNTQFFLEIVQAEGLEPFKSAVAHITTEENEILKLAAFLFRAGRTNERGGLADRSNQERSAQLFKTIALAIGFNPSLVDTMTYCVQFTYDPLTVEIEGQLAAGFQGDSALQGTKLRLIKRVLHLSHHTDLVRCFADEQHIAGPNKESLATLIDPNALEAVASCALNYARASCEATGTPYFFHHDTSKKMIPPPYLKAHAVTHVGETINTIMQLSHQFKAAIKSKDIKCAEELVTQAQNKNTFPKKLVDAATSIQRKFFAKRAHQITQQAVGMSAPEVSKRNLGRLENELRQGAGLSSEEKSRKGNAVLLEEERALYDYLVNEFAWTLKHITPASSYEAIQQDGNSLKSLHQRNRRARFNDVRFTSDFEGRSDNIYFTLAGPNGWPAEFLQETKGHEIRIPLRPFLKNNRPSDKLEGLWLSSAWYGFNLERKLLSIIDTTQRKIKYSKTDKSSRFIKNDLKSYRYERPDGAVLERKVSFADETVTADELLPFLTLHIIQELRFIGGQYRDKCLQNKTFILIEPLIDAICEQRNFEALLPASLDLNDPRIEINLLTKVSSILLRMQIV